MQRCSKSGCGLWSCLMIPKTDLKSGLLLENTICIFLLRSRYALLGRYFSLQSSAFIFCTQRINPVQYPVSFWLCRKGPQIANGQHKDYLAGYPSTYPSESVGLSQFRVLCQLLLLSESESPTKTRLGLLLHWICSGERRDKSSDKGGQQKDRRSLHRHLRERQFKRSCGWS